MLFLVRDPRGTMASRGNHSWCTDPECSKPNDLCKNLVSDYTIAKELLNKYPNQFAWVLAYISIELNIFHLFFNLQNRGL